MLVSRPICICTCFIFLPGYFWVLNLGLNSRACQIKFLGQFFILGAESMKLSLSL